MRHAIHTEIDIDAAPEVVWSVLTDLDGYAEWNPFMTESSGTVAVGERLTNRMHPPGGRAITFKPTVTAVDHGRVFEWLGRLWVNGLFDGRHRFELTPIAGGGTHLDHSESFSGVLVRVLRSSLDTQTREGFEAMNAALKARAEQVATCA
ncbi:MAG: SRPBCC domain-containing protein [Actinomycetota bacterium]